MAVLRVVVSEEGPYRFEGAFRLVTVHRDEVAPTSQWFCRCGASRAKPYCDGSHGTSDFGGSHDQPIDPASPVSDQHSMEPS